MSARDDIARRVGVWDAARVRVVAGVLLVAFLGAGALADLTGHSQGLGAYVLPHGPKARGLRGLAPKVPAPLHRRGGAGGPEDQAVSRVLARTPWISAGGRRRRVVALTFDDGPGPHTWRIVRVLRRMRVRATFFPVGQMVSAYPRAWRLVRRSFPVGDHTLTHPALPPLGRRRQAVEIFGQAARMHAVGERFPRLFRPPYGSFDGVTLDVLRRLRMLLVLWSVDSLDYERPGVRAIVRNVVSGVRPGAIVLMHDGGGPRGQTARALPFIVRGLRRRGFRFVTVPRMLLEAPPGRRQRLPRGVAKGR